MATAMHEESVSNSSNSIPSLPPDSPGSSVSSRMQEEYDELLKYAVVVPTIDPGSLPKILHDAKGSLLHDLIGQMNQDQPVAHARRQPTDGAEDEDGESTAVGDDEGEEDSTEQSSSEASSHQAHSTPVRSPSPTDIRNARFYNAVHSREVDKFLSTQKFTNPLITETDSVTELKLQQKQQQQQHQEPDRHQVADDQISSINGSVLSESPVSHITGFSPGIDPDIARMETLMEQWLGDLKRNVLAEFSHSRIRQMEGSRQNFQKEREKHAREMTSLQNELESMKELLHTYEQSIERKDEVITNLTRGMQKQKDKFDMLKTFCEWKIKHNDVKREGFASNLATKHYERTIQQKAWDAWHSLIEARWRQRVEKACQAKAQEVCMQLTNDYESKITSLNEALAAARAEVSRLHTERERYEETMKKAFMRGVCALNMEAMSMFHEAEQQGTDGHPAEGGIPPHLYPEGVAAGIHPVQFLTDQLPVPDHLGAPVSIPQEAMFTTEPPGAPAPRVVTSHTARPSQQSVPGSSKTAMKTKPSKVLKTKITARTDSGRGSGALSSASGTLAPPMSTVMVERHQPVTKQTIGHATAMKYPKSGVGPAQHTQSTILQRKVAGQAGNVGQAGSVQLVNTNIQTVKVVE